LKGEVTRAGIEAVTGLTMPIFEKRRFQRGAVDSSGFETLFPKSPQVYRRLFQKVCGA